MDSSISNVNRTYTEPRLVYCSHWSRVWHSTEETGEDRGRDRCSGGFMALAGQPADRALWPCMRSVAGEQPLAPLRRSLLSRLGRHQVRNALVHNFLLRQYISHQLHHSYEVENVL